MSTDWKHKALLAEKPADAQKLQEALTVSEEQEGVP